MYRIIASLSCFLFAVPFLSAQTQPAAIGVAGETIVVTADRITEPIEDATDSVTVITREDLERSQAVTVAEALRDIAGISIIQSGSAGHSASAFVRGASSTQVLLLVDGVEINDAFFGGADISSLLTGGVERIEIVRGPQSPLYGSQAMSGVINVVTTPAIAAIGGVDGTVRVEGGSMSTRRTSLQLGSGTEGFQFRLGGGYIDTAGQFDNDEFRDLQLNGRAAWSLNPQSTFGAHAFLNDSHYGIPFNGATPSPLREGEAQLLIYSADYTLRTSPLLNLEARASFTDRDDAFEDPNDPFGQTSSHQSQLLRLMAQNTMAIRAQTITFGVEHKDENVEAFSNGDPALDESIRTTAIYAQDKIEVGALLFTIGARIDDHSGFGTHASPRLSAAYRVNDQWRVRAAAGRAFRAPSAGELAYPFYGNPDLEPETSRSYEAGVDVNFARGAVSLTAFSTSYRDLITFDPATFVAGNIDRATIDGAELTAGITLSDTWNFNAAYTHLQTRDEETGLPLYRRPRNLASVTLSYDQAAWAGSVNLNAVGRRFETDFETFSDRYNSGYLKVDAAGSYQLRSSILLTARIENLFDREYAEAFAFPAPGRAFFGGLQFGF